MKPFLCNKLNLHLKKIIKYLIKEYKQGTN